MKKIFKFSQSESQRNQLILEGSIFKALLLLALPILANNFIGTLYNLGDAYWVSKLGDLPLATVNFIWPVTFLTLSIAIGVSLAGGTTIAQHIGANRKEDANEAAQQLYIFGIIFGLVAGIFGWFITPHVLKFMNAPAEIYDSCVLYLRIMFIDLPFMFMMNVFFSINQAQGNTVTPTIINGSSAILNIVLDPIFIFALGLGVQGAAIATVLSKIPFTIYSIYRLSKGMGLIKLRPFNFNIHKKTMLGLIKIGIPASIGNSGVALGFIVLLSIIADYGSFTLASFGIGNRINNLIFMPAQGVGAALATVVGQNLGAGHIDRVKKSFFTAIGLSLGLLSVLSVVLWSQAIPLTRIFSDTPEVLRQGSDYLRVLASTTWSFCFFYASTGLFNGSGHTKFSMVIEAGRLWLFRVPLVFIFGAFTDWGPTGIWYAVGLSNVIAGSIAFALTFTGVWKRSYLS